MSDKNPIAGWVAVGVTTTALIAATAYAGYKVFKSIEEIDLDNIFNDMNENFYPNYPGEGKE